MKICIFSDVHGNFTSIKQVFRNEEKKVDAFIFLGDIFGYFYEQKEIINQLAQIEMMYAIKGNHEHNYIKSRNDNSYKQWLIEKYGNSYDIEITSDNMSYIQGLPDFLEMHLGGKYIGVYHGGPLNYVNQRVYPDTELQNELYGSKYDYLLLGHTHYQLLKRVGKTVIINPGSVGQPRDGKGFSYCVLNTEDGYVDFRYIYPDIKELLNQVRIHDLGSRNYEYLVRKYEV